MCQLLGMNCNKPASLHFSLQGFVRRGGETDEHADGWGLGYFDGRDARLFRDHRPSAHSPAAELTRDRSLRSRNILAHIRKATQGAVDLLNCHPFHARLWGRDWLFAHNGNLEDFHPALDGPWQPAGTTDSERAFCLLLQRLRQRFGDAADAGDAPDEEALRDALQRISLEIAAHGSFNYLLSDGATLYTHRSTELHYLERAYPFRSARLVDCELSMDFALHNHLDDCMALIATRPLTTDEAWQPLPVGEVCAFSDGRQWRPRSTQSSSFGLAVAV